MGQNDGAPEWRFYSQVALAVIIERKSKTQSSEEGLSDRWTGSEVAVPAWGDEVWWGLEVLFIENTKQALLARNLLGVQ